MCRSHYVALLCAAALFASCSRAPKFAEGPLALETTSAGDFLFELHEHGLLPGDSAQSHGEIHSEMDPLPLPDQVTYPLTRTFHVAIKGESFTNHYAVVRSSKGSSWQLQKAWRTDSSGQTIQEWPTK